MAYEDDFGITEVIPGLSISRDFSSDDENQVIGVLLYTPNSDCHYHIELNPATVKRLGTWCDRYLDDYLAGDFSICKQTEDIR